MMKPSKDLNDQIDKILERVFSQGVRAGKDIALEKYEDYDAWKRGDEKQQLLSLVEQREREARINELEGFMATTVVTYGNEPARSVSTAKMRERIRTLKAGKD